MKRLLLLLLFPIAASAQGIELTGWAQTSSMSIFEASRYVPGKGMEWIPDFEERTLIGSDEQFYYTEIDSVIVKTNHSAGEYGTDSTVIVTYATYQYSGGERLECHACGVYMGFLVYEHSEGEWRITTFTKAQIPVGAWGALPEYTVEKIGPEQWGLIVDDGYGNQGYFTNHISIYPLTVGPPFRAIRLITLDGGPNGCEEECEEEYCDDFRQIHREWYFDQNIPEDPYTPYFDIVATVTEVSCASGTQNWTERYRAVGSEWERVCE